MQKYELKNFEFGRLNGISEKQIEEHLKLYVGYVKHTNLIREKIKELSVDKENNTYLISELRRRFGFEFNGMRMHEIYFEQLEGEPTHLNAESKLANLLSEKYGSIELAIEHIKEVGKSRGIGWVVLVYDKILQTPHTIWVSDHEVGQLGGLSVILAMDVWEHAFMVDYLPSEKGNYINTFFENLNWGIIEKRFDDIIK